MKLHILVVHFTYEIMEHIAAKKVITLCNITAGCYAITRTLVKNNCNTNLTIGDQVMN